MANWLITGVSSGFGRALAEAIFERGGKVAGTIRNEKAKTEFEKLAPGKAFGILLDVTDEAAAGRGVKEAEEKLGGIDVLVNNAGYGFEGAVEEAMLADFRAQFDVNVFGAVAMMQSVLPHMRARRRGHIVNISSIGGLTAFPGVGAYNGSKFALEGISEALAKEVKHLGIKVTIVEPGAFRTDWAGRSLKQAAHTIPDYDASVGAFRRGLAERNGRQPGDPRKAAEAIMLAVESDEPPLHLLLGPDALRLAGEKLGSLTAEILKWAPVSAGTNFSTN
ncbi:MAG TPA: oxidoreductase [Methylovirgula sp.]|nr:oxidoreductase [Methylovirgula sp.]